MTTDERDTVAALARKAAAEGVPVLRAIDVHANELAGLARRDLTALQIVEVFEAEYGFMLDLLARGRRHTYVRVPA